MVSFKEVLVFRKLLDAAQLKSHDFNDLYYWIWTDYTDMQELVVALKDIFFGADVEYVNLDKEEYPHRILITYPDESYDSNVSSGRIQYVVTYTQGLYK